MSNTLVVVVSAAGSGSGSVSVISTSFGNTTGGSYTYNSPFGTLTAVPPTMRLGGGITVTITNTGQFSNGTTGDITSVSIQGSPCTNVQTLSISTLSCVAPPSQTPTTSVSVQVQSTSWGSFTRSMTFAYAAATISGFGPSNGPYSGGQMITIAVGAGLDGIDVTAVTVNFVSVANILGKSTSMITIITAALAPGGSGPINIMSSTYLTTQSGSNYTYNLGTFSAVAPTNGPYSGNQSVAITGVFSSAGGGDITAVYLNNVPATIQSFSATGVVVVSTAGTGSGPVLVTSTSFGNTTGGTYAYNTPSGTLSATPSTMRLGGGQTVTIATTGSFFNGIAGDVTSVTIQGLACTGIQVVSTSALSCTAPASASGAATTSVTVTIRSITWGDYSAPLSFAYQAGTFTFSPSNGPYSGGNSITITTSAPAGTAVTNVTVNGVAVLSISSSTTTRVIVVAPAGTGAGPIIISSATYLNTSSSTNYIYNQGTINSVTPSAGPYSGNQQVTILGTFANTGPQITSVALNGVAATITGTTTTTSVTVISGPGSGFGSVTVQSSTFGSTVGMSYQYNTPNGTMQVLPTNGPRAGGQTVTISTNGFLSSGSASDVFAVWLRGVPASITGFTSQTVTVTSGASSVSGSGVVIVNSTLYGAFVSGSYTYNVVGSLSSVSPNNGPSQGSQLVILRGTNLGSGTDIASVTLNGFYAAIQSQTATSVAVLSGAGNGSGPVTIFSPSFGTTNNGAYTYNTPNGTLTASPSNGPKAGGQQITIVSSGFFCNGTVADILTVTLNGVAAQLLSATSSSVTVVSAPISTAGQGAIVVTSNFYGVLTQNNAYTYNPVATGLIATPSDGPYNGQNQVTISAATQLGANDITAVGFGNSSIIWAQSIVSQTTSQVVVVAPNGVTTAGYVNVTVISTAWGVAVGLSIYRFNIQPVITTVTPSNGRVVGGNSVTISGTTPLGAGSDIVSVLFGTSAASLQSQTTTSVVALAPSGITGVVNITVVSTSFGTAVRISGYTYNLAPGITSIVPNNGPQVGGNVVTITGSPPLGDGTDIATVSFAGVAVLAIVSQTSNTVTVVVPAGVSGASVNVSVISESRGTSNATNAYLYNVAPEINNLQPFNGPLTGANRVTITGATSLGANDVYSVLLAGIPATIVSQTASSVTVTANAASVARSGDVVVSSTSFGNSTAGNGYRYNEVAVITSVTPNNGPGRGGNIVTIVSSNTLGNNSDIFNVTLSTVPVQLIVSQNATSVVVLAASGLSRLDIIGNVSVTSTSYGRTLSLSAYAYNSLPVISTVTPVVSNTSGGVVVTVSGTTLGAGNDITTVLLAGVPAQILSQGASSVTVSSGACSGCIGTGNVTVISTSRGDSVLLSSFTYSNPQLSTIFPTSGAMFGGMLLTLTGLGFSNNVQLAVKFETATFSFIQTPVTFVNSTYLLVVVPQVPYGQVSLSVTNNLQQYTPALSWQAYGAVNITAVRVHSGPITGGTVTTIIGSGFEITNFTLIRFTLGVNSLYTSNLTVVSATEIVCWSTPDFSPFATSGLATVEVALNGQQYTFDGRTFLYYALPVNASAVSPISGPVTGATLVNVTGTGFTNTGDITVSFFDSSTAAVVNGTFLSATLLQVITPSFYKAESVSVQVALNGQQYASSSLFYLFYVQPVVVSSVSPNSGPTTGLTFISIVGVNFTQTNETKIRFSNSSSGYSSVVAGLFVSSTLVTCSTPSASAMVVSVEVGLNGQQFTSNGILFNFFIVPSPTSTVPLSGPATGSTLINIFGTDFTDTGLAVVRFTNGSNVVTVRGSVLSATQLQCISPAFPASVANIAVALNGQQFVGALSFLFYSVPITFTSTSPVSGEITGGTNVTIFGTDFPNTAEVVVSVNDTVPSVRGTWLSSTSLLIITPSFATVGQVTFTVAPNNQQYLVNSTVSFLYYQPVSVVSITPIAGLASGGTYVTVAGATFVNTGEISVRFTNGSQIASVRGTYVDSLHITCITPAFSTSTNSTLALVGVGLNSQQYTFNSTTFLFHASDQPSILISPNSGPQSGNTYVVISGSGFTSSPTLVVRFSNSTQNATVPATFISASQIACYTPVFAPQWTRVAVALDNQQFSLNTVPFLFYAEPVNVTTLSPYSGPISGATFVDVGGANFVATGSIVVRFANGSLVQYVNGTYMSNTWIRCVAPSFPVALFVAVDVALNGQQFSVSGTPYQYFLSPVAVISVSPTTGPLGGNTRLTVFGTNFTSTGQITVGFNGTTGNSRVVNATFVSSTSLVCFSPAFATAGVKLVTVALNGQQFTTTSAQFTVYVETLTYTSLLPHSGPVGGATTVVLSGTNFPNTTEYVIQLITNSTVNGTITGTFLSSTSLQFTTSQVAAAGLYSVLLAPNGQQFYNSSLLFTYYDVPVVSSINPVNGLATGGVTVTITGTGFLPTNEISVRFANSTTAAVGLAPAVYLTSSSITCTTPNMASFGNDTIASVVVALNGVQFTTANSVVFSFNGLSLITTGVLPTSGPQTGGTLITVSGFGFLPSAFISVRFTQGLLNATVAGTFVDAQHISCIVPSFPANGTVQVLISLNSQQYTTNSNPYIFYSMPVTVTSTLPRNGPISGGTALTVYGTLFPNTGPLYVSFNSSGVIQLVNATYSSSSAVLAVTPVFALQGPIIVEVAPNGQQFTSSGVVFNAYNAPVIINSTSPISGPNSGGTVITVFGNNLANTTELTVMFTIAATSKVVAATYLSATQARAITPNIGLDGLAQVALSPNNLQFTTNLVSFQFYAPNVTVISLSPRSGPVGGGTLVNINGTLFVNTSETFVSFTNGTVGAPGATTVTVPATFVSATLYQVYAPAFPFAAFVTVELAHNGQQFTANGIRYQYYTEPVLSSQVFPVSGPLSGGTVVNVTGINFANTFQITVRFGNSSNAQTVAGTYLDASTIQCISPSYPSAVPGDRSVYVALNGQQFANTTTQFFFYTAPVTVTAVLPQFGPQSGLTLVNISGVNFTSTGTIQVRFRWNNATAVVIGTFISSTLIQVFTPVFAPNSAPTVEVALNAQQFTSNGIVFRYYLEPMETYSLSVTSGPVQGQTLITVFGRNFVNTSAIIVQFGNTSNALASVSGTYLSASTVSCFSPSFASMVSSAVVPVAVSLNAQQFTNTTTPFFYYATPIEPSSALPLSGRATGGTTVTINGTNFANTGAILVRFTNGTTQVAVNASYVSATQIVCITPPFAAALPIIASVDVALNGQQYVPAAFQFFFFATTTFSTMTPQFGDVDGGTTITINGGNFTVTGTNFVRFMNSTGGYVLQPASLLSSTRLTVISPPQSMFGSVMSVAVHISQNLQQFINADNFTYFPLPINISRIYPTTGPITGQTLVTLTGSNFVNTSEIVVSFSDGVITSYVTGTFFNSTMILLRTPNTTSAGPVSVGLALNGQRYNVFTNFTYYTVPFVTPPLSPTSGPVSGATSVILIGLFFNAPELVAKFSNGVNFVTVVAVYVSPTKIQCTSPSFAAFGAQTVTVEVAPNGQQFTNNSAPFTFYPVPVVVSAVAPTTGANSGGTLVSITGSNFFPTGEISVQFINGTNSYLMTGVYKSSAVITITTVSMAPGLYTVNVALNGQQYTTNNVMFNVFDNMGGVVVTVANPAFGPASGATFVTLPGVNYVNTREILVRFSAAGNVSTAVGTFVSTTLIQCITPAFNASTQAVVDVALNGQNFNSTSTVFYFYQVPVISSSMSPNSGPIDGLTFVNLTGVNFYPTDIITVQLNGTGFAPLIVNATYVSPTLVTFTTPPLPGTGSFSTSIALNGQQYTNTIPFLSYATPVNVTGDVPSVGPNTGGTVIVLSGLRFVNTGLITVKFYMDESTQLISTATFVTSTLITTVSPSFTGLAINPLTTLYVALNGQQYNDFSRVTFAFYDLYNISALSVFGGPTLGNTSLTVTGSNFVNTRQITVQFVNGAQVAIVNGTFVSTTAIALYTPSWNFAAVTVSMSVALNGQQYSNMLPYMFYVTPTVTSTAPFSGPVIGQTQITITGSNYFNSSLILASFGGVAVPATFLAETQIYVVAPAFPIGSATSLSVDVELSMNAQQFTKQNNVPYLYYPNTVTTTNTFPQSSFQTGGTSVEVVGTNFVNTGQIFVRFNQSNVLLPVFATYMSTTKVAILTPIFELQPPLVYVDVALNGQQYTNNRVPFSIYAQNVSISGTAPLSGPNNSGYVISVMGLGFVNTGNIQIQFSNPSLAAPVIVTGSFSQFTLISCIAPAIPTFQGLLTVAVSLNGQDYVDSNVQFQYYSSLVRMTAFTPFTGPTTGNTTVNVTGVNFVNLTTIVMSISDGIHRVNVSAQYESQTLMTFTTPMFDFGALNVNTSVDVAPNGFFYTQKPLPFFFYGPYFITQLVPPLGPVSGNTTIQVQGTGFVDTQEILCRFTSIGNSTLNVIVPGTFQNASTPSILCVSPSVNFTSLTTTLEVAQNGQQYSINKRTFQFLPAVTISNLNPSSAQDSGNQTIVVSGANFVNQGYTFCQFGSPKASVLVPAFNITSTYLSCLSATLCQRLAVPNCLNLAPSDAIFVAVTTNGLQFSNALPLRYFALPTILQTQPVASPTYGGTVVTFSGKEILSGPNLVCRFDASDPEYIVAATCANSDCTQFTCVAPPHDAGVITGGVSNDGVDYTSFTYTYYEPPSVTGISPGNGPAVGGTVVTVFGTNFRAFTTTTLTSRIAFACNFSTSVYGGFSNTQPVLFLNGSMAVCVSQANPAEIINVTISNNGADFSNTSASFQYNPCTVGQSSPNYATACAPCRTGTYAPTTGLTSCLNCPPGSFANETGSSSCYLCPPGTSNALRGLDQCPPCALDTYQPLGNQTICERCPSNAGTFGVTGAITTSQCLCNPYFYGPISHRFPNGTGIEATNCTACPTGAKCNGGQFFDLEPGWWTQANLSYDFDSNLPILCPNTQACQGLSNYGNCSLGYTGVLCALCLDGWHGLGDTCLPCPVDLGISKFIIAIAVIGCIAVVCILLLLPTGRHVSLVKAVILVNLIQFIGLLGDVRSKWPPQISSLFNSLSFANINLDLIAPGCVAPFSFYTSLIVTMFTPVVLLAIVLMIYFFFKAIYWLKGDLRSRWLQTLRYKSQRSSLIILVLCYILVSKKAFEFFACRQINNMILLASNLEYICYDQTWFQYLAVAIITLIVYPVGILVWLTWLAIHIRHSLEAQKTQIAFGSFYLNYHERYYWWELVHMVRRLLTVVASALLTTQTTSQLVTLMMITYVSLVVHLVARPYKSNEDNFFQVMTDMIMFFASFGGLLYFTASLDAAANSTLTIFYILIFAAVAILILLFVTFKAYNFIKALMAARKARAAKLRQRQMGMTFGTPDYEQPEEGGVLARFRGIFTRKDSADFAGQVTTSTNPMYGLKRLNSDASFSPPEPLTPRSSSNPLYGRGSPASTRSQTPEPSAVQTRLNPLQRVSSTRLSPMSGPLPPPPQRERRDSLNPLYKPASMRASPLPPPPVAPVTRNNPLRASFARSATFQPFSSAASDVSDDNL
eukprot:TRINITY_DN9606_c0_g1_i1.p1 TRINITY_DN9606_c0_g1~~TRINITY_DN9606_c0_g1_i1.p1  ORF type:complete len:5899 (-),score=1194.87 TRINITY_DN9606_c0_g1_i1:131-16627(-)